MTDQKKQSREGVTFTLDREGPTVFLRFMDTGSLMTVRVGADTDEKTQRVCQSLVDLFKEEKTQEFLTELQKGVQSLTIDVSSKET